MLFGSRTKGEGSNFRLQVKRWFVLCLLSTIIIGTSTSKKHSSLFKTRKYFVMISKRVDSNALIAFTLATAAIATVFLLSTKKRMKNSDR